MIFISLVIKSESKVIESNEALLVLIEAVTYSFELSKLNSSGEAFPPKRPKLFFN